MSAELKSDNALLASQAQQSAADYMRAYLQRVRQGDIGALPIIIGLIIIAIIFQSANPNFLTPRNFVSLILQMAGITTIAYGVVFVLLLGEIDLSIGYVSAVASVTIALLLRPPSAVPWFVAVPLGIVLGVLIGFLHGSIITFFQLPSFVVTLAGLLAWNGVVLIMIGGAGTVIIQDQVVLGIANTFLPREVGWILGIGGVLLFAYRQYTAFQHRRSQGLPTKPAAIIAGEVVLLAVLTIAVVYITNLDRGLPLIGVGLILMLVIWTYVAERTRFGRYVYAVGGNKEAARRAGINTERIRIYVFMISSGMAALGGIILASRLRSVDTNAGGGSILLNSIAAAVIGGTSLFGGSGKVSSALLGALIIASVDNGMGLLGLSSGVKFVITGLVLLAAVVVDALARRNQTRSGVR
jgi:D-xylose transport system permease protein